MCDAFILHMCTAWFDSMCVFAFPHVAHTCVPFKLWVICTVDLWCIWRKCYCKVVFRAIFCLFGSHNFPCQSLLLGTNVPNNIYISNFKVFVYLEHLLKPIYLNSRRLTANRKVCWVSLLHSLYSHHQVGIDCGFNLKLRFILRVYIKSASL